MDPQVKSDLVSGTCIGDEWGVIRKRTGVVAYRHIESRGVNTRNTNKGKNKESKHRKMGSRD
jgi:hypothetical protein